MKSEKKDWRDGSGYKKADEKYCCVVCGSKSEIGANPKLNFTVCEQHSTLPPDHLFRVLGLAQKKKNRINRFYEWALIKNNGIKNLDARALVGYKLDYLALHTPEASVLVSVIPWGSASAEAINESLTKIISNLDIIE